MKAKRLLNPNIVAIQNRIWNNYVISELFCNWDFVYLDLLMEIRIIEKCVSFLHTFLTNYSLNVVFVIDFQYQFYRCSKVILATIFRALFQHYS